MKELEWIELRIEEAQEAGNSAALQRLYLDREKAQEREFQASLRRRAKAKEKK